MCEPTKPNQNQSLQELLSSLTEELMSAMSSLHMSPEPIQPKPDSIFLDELDYWANHSYEHMRACMAYIRHINAYLNVINNKLNKIGIFEEDLLKEVNDLLERRNHV